VRREAQGVVFQRLVGDPGVVVAADLDDALGRETLFAYGIVGGVNYRMGALYAGLDLGVRRTHEKKHADFDSRYATLKVGVNF
jgi:hypothetical protein